MALIVYPASNPYLMDQYGKLLTQHVVIADFRAPTNGDLRIIFGLPVRILYSCCLFRKEAAAFLRSDLDCVRGANLNRRGVPRVHLKEEKRKQNKLSRVIRHFESLKFVSVARCSDRLGTPFHLPRFTRM